MKLTLGLALSLCLAGLQFLAVLAVVSSSYVTSERALLNQARDLLSDIAGNTAEHSRSFLTPAEGAVELATRLAQNNIVASENKLLLEKLLFQQLRTTPQFAGIFYGDNEGNFVYVSRSDGPGPFRSKVINVSSEGRETDLIWRGRDYDILEARKDPDDAYDPRKRPWYRRAEQELTSVWTDPYIFFTSQKPGITVAAPVFRGEDRLRGVIGVDIEIDAISEFLGNLSVGESGKALIMNSNGDVIAHPDPSVIKTTSADGSLRFTNIGEIGDPISRAAFGHLAGQTEISVSSEIEDAFEYQGARYVSTLTPMPKGTLPWTIAVYAPEDDFIGTIKDNRQANILIAAAVAALTALVGLMLARRIHHPVKVLAARATQISQGVYDSSEAFPRTFLELEQANSTLTEEVARRRRTEELYGRTFDLASRGMAQISPETGAFTRVNARFSEILGYKQGALLGMSLQEILHPEDSDQTSILDEALSGNIEHLENRRVVRADGSDIWVQFNAIMIHDNEGPNHAVVTIDDITEKRQAQADIRKLNQELAQQERLNSMGQIAAGLAHELNQPLTALTQNSDAAIITAEALEIKDNELMSILKDLETQAHRAGDIIRAMRAFVRKDDADKTMFNLGTLIRQTAALMRSEAEEQGVQIRLNIGEIADVYGSHVQIAQILVNLIRNSIEAIAPTTDNQRLIAVEASLDGNTVLVKVSDTGPGVDPSIELFGQFETTKADGMGLGLPISRAIVEGHGGKMWYERGEGAGGAFCFTLPVGGG